MILNPVVVQSGSILENLGETLKNYIMQNGQKFIPQFDAERGQSLTCSIPTGSVCGIYCKPHTEWTEYMQDFLMLANPFANNQSIMGNLNDGDTLNVYAGGMALNLYTPYIGEVYVYGWEDVVLE